MHIEKEDVVDLLRSRGQHDKAASVECALPRHVDVEEDAGLLHQFDLNVSDITEAAGGDPDGSSAGAV